MSCNYFILTNNDKINENSNNQIIFLNKYTYILPYNNIHYYIDNGLFEKNLI